jgi:peroxidase
MAAATAGISRTSEAAATADPTMDPGYGSQLLAACPPGVDVNVAVDLDPETPKVFHNQYFINLQKGMGLLTSDQVLYADLRSRPIVDNWAANSTDFQQAPSPLASSSPPSRLPLKFAPSPSSSPQIISFIRS